ncbi:MAG: YceI family protein [Bacteroidetes bacterium]|nr:YceI family protein [Bacteroidota bacterium]
MGRIFTILLLLSLTIHASAQDVYIVSKGQVSFSSKAKQELIRATSRELKGLIDIKKKTFAFKIPIMSFIGFNSPVQRLHFNENYMESDRFPESTFTGKIIEDFVLNKDGVYKVRAKGKLDIHGISQERIIDVEVTSKNNKITFKADFVVPLNDHNIKVPRVVYDKLATDIKIQVTAEALPK